MAQASSSSLEILETSGRYQLLLAALLGFIYCFVSINHALPTFHSYTPPYGCQNSSGNASLVGCVTSPMGSDSCLEGYVFNSERGDETVVTEWSLVCNFRLLAPMVSTLYYLGVTVGAVLCGALADKWGRRPVLLLCLYAQAVLGALLPLASELWHFAAGRALQGVFVQGLQGATYTLLLEMFPTSLRTAVGVALELFWALGLCLLAGMSYLLPRWRDLQLAVSLPVAITLLYCCFIPESVRWLVTQMKSAKAAETLQKIARFNKLKDHHDTTVEHTREKPRICGEIKKEEILKQSHIEGNGVGPIFVKECDVEQPRDTSVECSQTPEVHISGRFQACVVGAVQQELSATESESTNNVVGRSEGSVRTKKQRLNSIAVYKKKLLLNAKKKPRKCACPSQSGILQLFCSRVLRKYTIVMMFVWFSASLAYYGIMLYLPALSGDRHANFAFGAVLEMLSYLSAYLVLSRLGRRVPLCLYLLSSGAICCAVGGLGVASQYGTIQTVLTLIGKAMVVSAFCAIFLYTSELFPTVLRAAAMGLSSTFGRVGSLLAPQLLLLGDVFPAAPLLVIGALVTLAGLAVLTLPETLDVELTDTVAETERRKEDPY